MSKFNNVISTFQLTISLTLLEDRYQVLVVIYRQNDQQSKVVQCKN